MSPAVEQGWRWFKNAVYFVAIAAGVKLLFGTYYNGVNQIPVALFGFVGGVIFFGMPAFVLGWFFSNFAKVGAVVKKSIKSKNRLSYNHEVDRLLNETYQIATRNNVNFPGPIAYLETIDLFWHQEHSPAECALQIASTYLIGIFRKNLESTATLLRNRIEEIANQSVSLGLIRAEVWNKCREAIATESGSSAASRSQLSAVDCAGFSDQAEAKPKNKLTEGASNPQNENSVFVGVGVGVFYAVLFSAFVYLVQKSTEKIPAQQWAPPNAPPLPEGFTWIKPEEQKASSATAENWAPPNAPPLPEGFTWIKPENTGAAVNKGAMPDSARVSGAAILLIRTDADCLLSVNGSLLVGQIRSVGVNAGDQLIDCASLYGTVTAQANVERGAQRVVKFQHLSREIEERNAKARESYLNNTPEL